MKTQFIQRFYDPVSGAAGAASGINPIGAAIAGVQGALGIIQSISGNAKAKRLMSQRQAYKTPEEYFKILRAAQANAQQGYDASTLDYLTNQVDRGASQAYGTAARLGADPNQLSAIFDQKMQGLMKIGAENHALNLQNFGKYLSALDVIGQNKAAEWSSQQDIIKDQLQAASAEKQAGIQNIGSAANAAISLTSAARTSDLFTGGLNAPTAPGVASVSPVASPAVGIASTLPNVAMGASPAGIYGNDYYGNINQIGNYIRRPR